MATKDVAQRPYDLASASASGQAIDATDAAHVATAGTPANVAAAGALGASFDAARADHAHQGVHSATTNGGVQIVGDVDFVNSGSVTFSQVGNAISAAVAGAGVNKNQIGLSDTGQHSIAGSAGGEVIVAEFNVDSTVLATPTVCLPFFSAIESRAAGTSTYRMRVGATAPGSTAGSTIRATFTGIAADGTGFVQKKNAGAAFNLGASDAGAGVLVQFTIESDNVGGLSNIRGISAALSG